MTNIPGRLIVALLQDRMVRMVFLPTNGDKDAYPIKETDLDAAELLFMACGLSAEGAAKLCLEMCANKVAGVDICVDEEIAARFRHEFPPKP
jgi:hypothetical protein